MYLASPPTAVVAVYYAQSEGGLVYGMHMYDVLSRLYLADFLFQMSQILRTQPNHNRQQFLFVLTSLGIMRDTIDCRSICRIDPLSSCQSDQGTYTIPHVCHTRVSYISWVRSIDRGGDSRINLVAMLYELLGNAIEGACEAHNHVNILPRGDRLHTTRIAHGKCGGNDRGNDVLLLNLTTNGKPLGMYEYVNLMVQL